MYSVSELTSLPKFSYPIGLTIGSFDGVHLGHQFLINTLRSRVGEQGIVTVLTFSNHPSEVITGSKQTPLLCSLEYKIKLLERAGVDLAIVLPFTEEMSKKHYNVFIQELHNALPFGDLVLGQGAAFGKDLLGNEKNVKKLGSSLGYQTIYLPKKIVNNDFCSSGRIRSYLAEGNLKTVALLLGRPYALYGKIKNNLLETAYLCLPPKGEYPLKIRTSHEELPGTALVNDQVFIKCKKNLLECTIEAIFL